MPWTPERSGPTNKVAADVEPGHPTSCFSPYRHILKCDLIEQELCKHHVFNISAVHIRVFQDGVKCRLVFCLSKTSTQSLSLMASFFLFFYFLTPWHVIWRALKWEVHCDAQRPLGINFSVIMSYSDVSCLMCVFQKAEGYQSQT